MDAALIVKKTQAFAAADASLADPCRDALAQISLARSGVGVGGEWRAFGDLSTALSLYQDDGIFDHGFAFLVPRSHTVDASVPMKAPRSTLGGL